MIQDSIQYINDNTVDFVHLHLHTQFSLLDGALKIDKLFGRCQELGQRAVAITDHGNLFGALEFFKAAVKHSDASADPFSFIQKGGKWKVKPIIGCEVYIADNIAVKESVNGRAPKHGHLILLAKNNVGYHNLVKLVSIAYKDGMYYKPRIDFDLLSKYHQGLICMSACLSGRLSQYILAGEYNKALTEAKRHRDLFGEDYYIEIQDHGLIQQKQAMSQLVKIAHDLNIKLVASNDVHYLNESDAEMQKVLQCISYRTTVDNLHNNNTEDYQEVNEFYLKSGRQMSEIFVNFQDAIANTIEIADKCECDFFVKQPLLPQYIPPQGYDAEGYLRRIALQGLQKRLDTQDISQERLDRLNYELGVICDLGFVDYFLIVWDFIHFAESNKIPVGPGRGSGAGSLVAFSLGITKLDPIKYGLIFERFLNRERVSNPDFDIDFCVIRREEVIKYVVDKYGADNVTQIVTFGTLAAKAAIKDTGRVYNYPYNEVEKITKTMPKLVHGSLLQMLGKKPPKSGANDLTIPDFVNMYNSDAQTRQIVDMAIQIEGMPRQTGIHAAGVVICKDPVYEHVPIMRTTDDKLTTQFNMTEVEQLGLLKMDFLGLNTLTDIDGALAIIKQTRGVDIDFYNIEYDDADVYAMIGEGDTQGVFQLESGGMKSFMRNLRPSNIEDIIAGIALYRPGPMDKIPEYVAGKRDPNSIKYPHPVLQDILHMTYGVIVYQEQVMQIVQELAGYTLGRADIVRRLMSKKKPDEMAREVETFLHGTPDKVVTGALAKGVSREVAEKVFEDMTSFANYAFNKSHAAAYAYLSYQTAYLKYHYPQEFFASMLNNRITKIEEVSNYLGYIKEKGIKILPPSINDSYSNFVVQDNCIRMGMSAIKNVGVGFIDNIVKDRQLNGRYKDFGDFITRLSSSGLNKKNLEAMIWTGCFDEFGHTRPQLIASFEQLMIIASKDKEAANRGQFSFFDTVSDVKSEFVYPNLTEYPLLHKLKLEKEAAGIYLTGHPLQDYIQLLKTYPINTASFVNENINSPTSTEEELEENNNTISSVKDGDVVTLAGVLVNASTKFTRAGKEIGLGRLEDMYGSIEVMVGYSNFERLRSKWTPNSIVSIKGKVSDREGIYTIWISEINQLVEYKDITVQPQPHNSTSPTAYVSQDNTQSNSLYIRCNFEDNLPLTIQQIKDIAKYYPNGNCALILQDTESNDTIDIECTVDNNETLLLELCGVLGSNCISTT
jgi:DNA polymerase-3 subunit alpha